MFTVGPGGGVTLGDSPPAGVTLERIEPEEEDETGTVSYVMTIRNYPQIRILKTDERGNALPGAVFLLNTRSGASPWSRYNDAGAGISAGVIDLTRQAEKVIPYLPDGYYQLIETEAPPGYLIKSRSFFFQVRRGEGDPLVRLTDSGGLPLSDGSGPVTVDRDTALGAAANGGSEIVLTLVNYPGAELPNTGGPGTGKLLLLGFALMLGSGLTILRRRPS